MAGRSSRSGGNSNERIQALVEQKLGEGLQYEALQLYRGVVSRKSARGNDDAALAIAEQGIGVLLGRGFPDSATELGNVLVGILSDHELPPTEERVGVIKRVNAKYEDAKRASILAEEDRQAEREDGGVEGEVADGVTGEKEAARGMYSVGVLQVINERLISQQQYAALGTPRDAEAVPSNTQQCGSLAPTCTGIE